VLGLIGNSHQVLFSLTAQHFDLQNRFSRITEEIVPGVRHRQSRDPDHGSRDATAGPPGDCRSVHRLLSSPHCYSGPDLTVPSTIQDHQQQRRQHQHLLTESLAVTSSQSDCRRYSCPDPTTRVIPSVSDAGPASHSWRRSSSATKTRIRRYPPPANHHTVDGIINDAHTVDWRTEHVDWREIDGSESETAKHHDDLGVALGIIQRYIDNVMVMNLILCIIII